MTVHPIAAAVFVVVLLGSIAANLAYGVGYQRLARRFVENAVEVRRLAAQFGHVPAEDTSAAVEGECGRR